MSKTLAIIGAGELGRQIAHLATTDNYCQQVVFFDDFNEGVTTEGYSIAGATGTISDKFKEGLFDELVIGVGYRHMKSREAFYSMHAGAIPFATIVHSSAYVDPKANLREGVIVYPRCCIDAGARIDANVLLNLSCTIAHDTQVGSHTFVAPGVVLAGFVNIGEQCMLGVGTTVIDAVSVAPGVQTGGGTVVIKDLTVPGLYVGSPARFIRST